MEAWHTGVRTSARVPAIIGFGILLLWGGGFGAWAALAPLKGAVVASGTFVATGQNKLIQHLEGGIIRTLAVKEGDLVEPNQVLVQMDDTAPRAKLRRLVLKKYRLVTMKARLEAEMRGGDTFELPAALLASRDDPEVDAIYRRQRTEMRTRKANLDAEELVLRKEISGLEESIGGFETQLKHTRQRLALFGEELKDKASLFERQLVRKTEVLQLQRAEASLAGEIGELTARIADSRERIARASQRIVQLHSAAAQKAVEELRQTEAELDDVLEQIRAAQDVVERIEVRSPVRGVVVKMHFHTAGGVAAPGAVIMELLPIQDELVIEAKLNPRDIPHVRDQQEALVRIASANQRVTPMIKGKVIYLSADALAGQTATAKGELAPRSDFYIVRIRLEEADTREHIGSFRPSPGMPADVYIQTGERTFFDYIMRPVMDSFSRAFRES